MESSVIVFPSESPKGSWFAEAPLAGFCQGYEVHREILRTQSPYQSIAVLETELLGTTLVLEGAVQTSTLDEHIYHEMLVHPALVAVRLPRSVLVIGGGDGGALRRVLEHRSVQRAVEVEIDEAVIRVSREYLPSVSAGAYDDPRATLVVGDGVRFMAETSERFDAILVDSTDPVGPAEALFSVDFYRSAARILNEHGVLVTQSGSPLLMGPELARAYRRLASVFPVVRPYLASIPSYPGVLWSFLSASKRTDVGKVLPSRIRERMSGIVTRYYTPAVHGAAFALPADLLRSLDHQPEDEVGLLPRRATVSR